MNVVFLDLDESLISSERYHAIQHWNHDYLHHKIGKRITTYTSEGTKAEYNVLLRSGAKEFISELRKKYTVCILTSAEIDYACAINRILDLGFENDKIFARESMDYFPQEFRSIKSVLFDNLPECEIKDKTRWLKVLGPYKIVNVLWFYGDNDEDVKWTQEIIQNYLKLLEEYFNEQ